MVLNKGPENFFAEVEQVAVCPGNVVPGIDFSNDPLLQGRLFSYLDTQLIRLGGPNFHEIPINRPLAAIHNNQRDGYHRMQINRGKVSYFPNAIDDNFPRPASRDDGGYVHYAEKVEGKKVRERSEKFKDFFSQARSFWNSMSKPEKDHIIRAFHFEVGKVESKDIRQKVVDQFAQVDRDLASKIAIGVGANPPAKGSSASNAPKFPTFSMENTVKNTIKSRKVAILADNGFNGPELSGVKKAIEENGGHAKVVSMYLGTLKGDGGQEVKVDKSYVTTGSIMFDAVFAPGGQKSIDALMTHGAALHFINEAFKHCKPIGATSEGVDLLTASEIKGVGFADPGAAGQIKSDKGVVTVRKLSSINDFNSRFIQAIAQHRHWDREMKDQVPA